MNNFPILNKESVKQCELDYLELAGIDSRNLLEIVGFSCAKEISNYYGPLNTDHIVIYAGPGKNGGDGISIALFLAQLSEKITICMPTEPSHDFLNINIKRIKTFYPDINFTKSPVKGDIYVDALFGIGLNKKPEGIFEQLIRSMNDQSNPVVSIDVPSGVDANTSKILGEATVPDLTLAVGCLKPVHQHPKADALCGKTICVDIGMPHNFIEKYAVIQKVA